MARTVNKPVFNVTTVDLTIAHLTYPEQRIPLKKRYVRKAFQYTITHKVPPISNPSNLSQSLASWPPQGLFIKGHVPRKANGMSSTCFVTCSNSLWICRDCAPETNCYKSHKLAAFTVVKLPRELRVR